MHMRKNLGIIKMKKENKKTEKEKPKTAEEIKKEIREAEIINRARNSK